MTARSSAIFLGVCLSAVCLGAQVAPPRDTPIDHAPTGTARISGRVFAAETGNPLPKAQVRLSSNRLSLGAFTDGEGRYEFTNLPAAPHSISVSKAGYVSLQYGQRRPFESGRPLILKDGQHADRTDFLLPRGSVITGRITDEYGLPVTGARVQALRYQYLQTGERRLGPSNTGMFFNQVTDDLGQFRVFGLAPGAYVVAAHGPQPPQFGAGPIPGRTVSMPVEGYAVTYYPGVIASNAAAEISVGLGQEVTASFPLIPARLARISGMVLGSQGQPAANISVSLRQEQANSVSSYGMRSDVTGNFSISNVSPGEYFIDVRPTMGGGPNMPPAPRPDAEFASVPITVTGEDISGLVVVTSRGATITGRAVFEGTRPRPPSSAQLRVMVTPLGRSLGMPVNPRDGGLVDESGNFRLDGIAGSVLFRGGAAGWVMKSVHINGVDVTDIPYEVKAGSSVSNLEIVFTDQLQTVAGTAIDSAGQPLKDYVAVFVPQNLPEGAVPTRWLVTRNSSEDGRYEIRSLPPGDYAAAAVASLEQGVQFDPAFQDQIRQRGMPVRVSEGEVLNVDLRLLQ
jgi:hypothetical protein